MCMFGLQKSEGSKCPALGHGKTMVNEIRQNVSGASGSTHAVYYQAILLKTQLCTTCKASARHPIRKLYSQLNTVASPSVL